MNSALLMIDIDYFKAINDTHGHECGDEVLRHFAAIVRSQLEKSDYFIRLGGEEFSVCVSRAETGKIQQLADSIRSTAERSPLIYQGKSVKFTVSIGVATKEVGEACTVDEMLSVADANLYTAKSRGRNLVVRAA